MNRIPPDAFEKYAAMGPSRSYRALGRVIGISKRTIVKRAIKEKWQERLAAIEHQAQVRTDTKAAESLEGMKSRHLRTLSAVLGRALEALKAMPISNAMDAVRAIDLVLKQEQKIRNTDTEDAAGRTLEEVAARESERLLRVGPANPDDPDEY